DYVKRGLRPDGRTLCDRVIRACNQQLGMGTVDSKHLAKLVSLVQLALRGYESVEEPGLQSSPLYMEKILFHIMKKLVSQGTPQHSQLLGSLLYKRLAVSKRSAFSTEMEDFCVLVRSCFVVLWNGVTGTQPNPVILPRERLQRHIQALSFLLLLEGLSDTSPFSSKVAVYTEDALIEFVKSCGTLSENDASYLLQEIKHYLIPTQKPGKNPAPEKWFAVCEVLVHTCRLLFKANHWVHALDLVTGVREWLRDSSCLDAFLELAQQAVEIHRFHQSEEENSKALTDCARIVRGLPSLGDQECHVILQVCQLIVSALEMNQNKGHDGKYLLTWFSFLEEYQELISRHLCKLEDGETLERVLLYCKATAAEMMNKLQNLASDSFFNKAASAVNSMACALYNRRMYDQAFAIVETLCRELMKNNHPSLSVEKLNRAFLLAVQSSRKRGQLDCALDWVVYWLQALGDQIMTHMAEPITLWVKTKADAARGGEEDMRLRTLRDGFGANVPEEGVMLSLLEEELRAYREVAGDTAQERYNVLCDLLDICHEGSMHTHRRAVYLYEMAQVVCFQDFSEQTDCSAVDFTVESLRLLNEEQETAENTDQLMDDKAQASLWLYICTLEKNLQDAMDFDRKRSKAQEQRLSLEPVGTNDLDYEDKQKQQDSQLVYEGLCFNLTAERKCSEPLDKALELWRNLLAKDTVPVVRTPKQTVSSIVLMAALYKLMGKPLRALESHQLAVGFSHKLSDAISCASSMCYSARLLLEMGTPELAQLEQAEKLLPPVDSSSEGISPLHVFATLVRAELCYRTNQVEKGVSHLCQVLKEVGEQRHSKSWYLLRARALQTASAYLGLDVTSLPSNLRQRITEYGLKTPDTTLYDSLKLLCSLVVTLVGNGLYGTNVGVDTRFVDQGDNVLLKWQLLAEVLSCSFRMVAVRRLSGAVHEAKVQCLEALKLTTKLQTLSQCAEFLVMKAELELQKGESTPSGMDLEQVKDLLDLCTDFTSKTKKMEVKIKPRKGRPAKKPACPAPVDDDCSDLLKTRSFFQQPVAAVDEWAQSASPKLRSKDMGWLVSLGHKADCCCLCCSDPGLGRVCVRWAAAQAELALHLHQGVGAVQSQKLFLTALSHCRSVTAKLSAELFRLMPAKDKPYPSFLDDLMGRIYLRMSLSSLELPLQKSASVWELLDSGFAFVASRSSPELESIRVSLQATKALAYIITLAAQNKCRPEELFSAMWTWNPMVKADQKAKVLWSNTKAKDPVTSSKTKEVKKVKDPGVSITCQETKMPKDMTVHLTTPKVKMAFPSSKNRSLSCKTPHVTKMSKSKSATRGQSCAFDFDNEVPQIAVRPHTPPVPCTPVQKVKTVPPGRQGAMKPAPKLQFQVYNESSPPEAHLAPVPAAPRRSTRSRFKVEFSDESDVETSTLAVNADKQKASKLRASSKVATTSKPKVQPPTDKRAVKGRGKAKKSTVLPAHNISSEEELVPCAPRKGRCKKQSDIAASAAETEELEQMRTIKEEEYRMDTSVEELKISDAEENETLDGLTLELVRDLLCSTLLSLQHFPPLWIYPRLCGLLALAQGDLLTTAMLHSQSLGITARHHMTRHLATRLKKLKKDCSSDLVDKLDSLSLDDACAQMPLHQKLTELERIFTFPTTDPSAFPHQHCEDFTQQLKMIPSGVTVCLLSVVGVQPREIGDTVLLTRLERDASPVTVCIPTAQLECPVSAVIQEMDNVQKQQKVVSSVADKAQWWEGRRSLDTRMERLLDKMKMILGCWQGLLLPITCDPELSSQVKNLSQTLSEFGVHATKELLKVVLSASPLLSQQDLHALASGLCPERAAELVSLLQVAVSALSNRAEPQGHTVLILDKYLQKLPWESISCLRSHSVTRMPSLHFLIGHCLSKKLDPTSVLNVGVDLKKVFYVLNPDANLKDTEERFKEWFAKEPAWKGVCGTAPNPTELQEAVTTKDLYIYVGHGAGARFLDGQRILKEDLHAASLLFGCSSAALAVYGELEGSGIILNYLMAGCPLILGNLWDVTDRDIDRFTKALLQSWFSAGPGAALLNHMASSRQATHLKYLIGAAPVVYGLPVSLQKEEC
ncbi:separin-like, partial [Scleropages formosus]